jgi:uncharacterized membrane protein
VIHSPRSTRMSAPEKMTAVTEFSDQSRAIEFRRIARRNNSLSSTGRLLAFVFIFVVSVGIAAAFAVFGAWLILPFAGVEMLVLYLALRYFERHADDYERIEIDGDQVRLERLEGGSLSTAALSRYWARVAVSRDGSRLALRSHGREFEIGRNLSDEQRLELAQALQRRLRRDETSY